MKFDHRTANDMRDELMQFALRVLESEKLPTRVWIGPVRIVGYGSRSDLVVAVDHDGRTAISMTMWTKRSPELHYWDPERVLKALYVLKAHFILDYLADI